MGPPFELDAEVSVRPRRAYGIFAGLFILAAVLIGVASMLDDAGAAAGVVVTGVGSLGFGLYFNWVGARFLPARVRIGSAQVALGDLIIPRGEIRAAYWTPPIGFLSGGVRLVGKRGRTFGVIGTRDAEAAAPILRALGMSASQTTASFTGAPPRWSSAWWAFVATFAVGMAVIFATVPHGSNALRGVGILAIVAAAFLFLRSEMTVGADGVLVATRVGRRFIPWSDVDYLEPYWRGILIHTCQGPVKLPITTRLGLSPREAAEQRAFLERASQALEGYRRGKPPDAEARLARGTRTQAEWLRDLFDRQGDFREAPLPDEQIWDVLESAAADASARAGAAAVVARSATADARRRLRVAADACSAPRLRVVLERAASGASEAEVEEAMAELAESEAAR